MDLHNPDYAALASACGAQGYAGADVGALEDALRKAFSASSPTVIDVATMPFPPPALAPGWDVQVAIAR